MPLPLRVSFPSPRYDDYLLYASKQPGPAASAKCLAIGTLPRDAPGRAHDIRFPTGRSLRRANMVLGIASMMGCAITTMLDYAPRDVSTIYWPMMRHSSKRVRQGQA